MTWQTHCIACCPFCRTGKNASPDCAILKQKPRPRRPCKVRNCMQDHTGAIPDPKEGG